MLRNTCCGPAVAGQCHPCAEQAEREPEPSPVSCDDFYLDRL